MPRIHLNVLKRFNSALVYTLEPESMPGMNDNQYRYIENYVGQQADVLEALIYAQDKLLPALETGFEHLTPEQFTHWIKTIHKKAAKTIFQFYNKPSGSYSTEGVLRWEDGVDIMLPIRGYLSKQLPNLSCESFCKILKRDYPSLDLSTFVPFMHLLMRIRDDESIEIEPIAVAPHEEINKLGLDALNKLQLAYHTGLLTPNEKILINQYVKICILPSQYESAMNAYAAESIEKLQRCDRNDIDSVSHVLADIFYGLVDIHPFINGNGRTATVLLNTLCCALSQPSILLRYPNDRDDKSSLYSQAFSVVNTTREPLAALIKHRLISTPYDDALSAQVAEEKSEVLNRLRRLEKHSNHTVVEQQFNQIIEEFSSRNNFHGLSQKAIEKSFTGYALTSLQVALLGSSGAKKSFLKETLALITGPSYQWKFFNDKTLAKNPIAYIELSDEPTQEHLAALLTATNTMKVTATRRADNKIPVIKLEAFDFTALLEIEQKEENDALEQSISSSCSMSH